MPEAVVVTGGSAGVGRAIARAFAAQGAPVAILARGRERFDSTRAELEALGTRMLALSVDVAAPDQIEAVAACIEAELGPIDIWVNSAMATVFSPLEQITSSDGPPTSPISAPSGAQWRLLFGIMETAIIGRDGRILYKARLQEALQGVVSPREGRSGQYQRVQ